MKPRWLQRLEHGTSSFSKCPLTSSVMSSSDAIPDISRCQSMDHGGSRYHVDIIDQTDVRHHRYLRYRRQSSGRALEGRPGSPQSSSSSSSLYGASERFPEYPWSSSTLTDRESCWLLPSSCCRHRIIQSYSNRTLNNITCHEVFEICITAVLHDVIIELVMKPQWLQSLEYDVTIMVPVNTLASYYRICCRYGNSSQCTYRLTTSLYYSCHHPQIWIAS